MLDKVRAVWMRGGTSKGLFFHASDLPADPEARDALILRAMGSPDPHRRQLDGMGGGISSLSKVAIISPPTQSGADVDYTFIQVGIERAELDASSTCGNLTAAVGPFAVEEGLVEAADGAATVRIYNRNARQMVEAVFPVAAGLPLEAGATQIAGVSFPGAPVQLRFLDPGGSSTGELLPAGAPTIELNGLACSLVDAAALTAFVRAEDLGLTGIDSPEALDARPDLLARLEGLRRAAAVAAGLVPEPQAASPATPRIALLARPLDYVASDGSTVRATDYDLSLRMLSLGRPHRAAPATGAMCLATAAMIHGALPADLLDAPAPGRLRVGHPGGVIEVGAEMAWDEGVPSVRWTGLTRTARRLMEGFVRLPRG